MYFQSAGQRVFNIKIGNTVVVENMDVYAKTGAKYAAHEEYIEIQVKNGEVTYKGIEVPGAIKNGQIQITFSKGKADNPIVQGIVIYNGPISCTLLSYLRDHLRRLHSNEKELGLSPGAHQSQKIRR